MTGLALDWIASNLYITEVGSAPSVRLLVVNDESPTSRSHVVFNRFNSAVRWPLDISLCLKEGKDFVYDVCFTHCGHFDPQT